MKKRVLQVISSLSAGGAETLIMNIFKNVDRDKVQFDFLVFGSEEGFYSKEIIDLGGRIFSIEPVRVTGVMRYMRNLIATMKKNGPYEAVHSHIDYLSGFVALAARVAGVKKRICHSHNTDALTYKGQMNGFYMFCVRRLILTNSTKLFACSNNAAQFMYGDGMLKKTTIINNAIDLQLFCSPLTTNERNELLNNIGINKNTKIIGNIARFVPQKNHKRIIKIFKALCKLNPEYELVLIGDGYLKPEIITYAKEIGLEEKIHFLGLRKDIHSLIKLFDVFLLPSLFEGFPLTLVEAQAAGIYSVISDDITKEIDLGLNLLEFVSLNSGDDIWAKSIIKNQEQKVRDPESSKQLISQRGFDIRENLNIIYDEYVC